MNVIDLKDSVYNFPFLRNYENCKIEKIDHSIPYSDFFERFLKKNWPCVVKNIAAEWESTTKWVLDNAINYDFILSEYGDLEAPVADCNDVAFSSHSKVNMPVATYVSYLKNKTDQLLYLKDWHLRRLRPQDNFYQVPSIFASDWLNEFAKDHQDDDFMFVYMGPKNSWTPLHADVYSSFSWSVNVVGRKRWIMFPPGEENKLKDNLGNLPLLFTNECGKDVKHFEIIQEKGDAIFVPSGWYHQVFNVLDTISINHNWINGCNIENVWKELQANLIAVENEINEFRDMDDYKSHCQLMLKSMFGMDFKMFFTFIHYIGKKRLAQLHSLINAGDGKTILGMKHLKFDLLVLLQMTLNICQHKLFSNNDIIPMELQKDIYNLQQSLASCNL